MQNKRLLFIITVLFSLSIQTENAIASETSYKFTRNYYTYTVNPDGSYTTVVQKAVKLLKEDALEGSKQQDISYSTSVEKVEVIDAYTKKAKGQRIDAPKSNFQLEVNSGKDKAAPAFSDRTTLTIIFPDVAVGDTIYRSYKITQTEPLFPNQFSQWGTFSKYYVYDDVRIIIDILDSMPTKYELAGLTEKKTRQKNGRKIFEWTYHNNKSVDNPNDWGDVYQFGKGPGYLISTSPSRAAIAQAYGVRAKQQAVVTERIQKLADEITKGKTAPYDQAKALYEWVSYNISYAGNCIGVGAVVPRDTNFVLDNRMGDGKDHATLLEALLAAKKITSTQALINSGSIYNLPKIPVVSMVNHVLNYIPSLNIYADSTSEDTPFGMLPDSEMGKPILLVDGYQEGLKTPVILHNSEKTITESKISIGVDGSAKGQVVSIYKGRSGLFSNTQKTLKKYHEFKNNKESVEEYSRSMVKKYGLEGGNVSYKLDEHPKSPDVASSEITFDVKGFTNAGSLGAFNINPIFSSSLIYSTIKSMKTTDEPSSDFNCKGEHMEEIYNYEFPKNLKILAVPDNISVSNALVSFQASYVIKENRLTVTRRFDDLTLGPVCEPKIYKAYKELADKVMPNLKSQIVYKYI